MEKVTTLATFLVKSSCLNPWAASPANKHVHFLLFLFFLFVCYFTFCIKITSPRCRIVINHLLQTHCRQVDSWTQHRGMQGYSWRLSSPDWLYVSILGHFTSLPWETVLGKTNTLLSWPCTKSQDHLMCLMRWFECGLPYCKKLCPQPVFRGIALLKGAEMLELPHLMKHSSPCLRSDLRA